MVYTFILIIVTVLASCDKRQEMVDNDRQKQIDSWTVVKYDGCEYVVGNKKGMHKGNCSNPIHTCKYN